MRDGLIRVAVATPRLRVADCAFNAQATVELARQAAEKQVRVLVFPELGLTGATCGDLFLQPTLLDGAWQALEQVRRQTAELGILLFVGLPVRHAGKLYNCAAALCGGQLLGLVSKTRLDDYGVSCGRRWFTASPQKTNYWDGCFDRMVPFGKDLLFCCNELPDLMIAAELGEDLQAPNPPSAGHAVAGATVVVNLSASNETAGAAGRRRALVTGQSARLTCGYLYAGAGTGESTTDLVFAGHNLIAENGVLLAESPRYTEGLTITELDVGQLAYERRRANAFPPHLAQGYLLVSFSLPVSETPLSRPVSPTPFLPQDPAQREACCQEILQLQAWGLCRRLEHTQSKKALIGVSGGLDSALALLVAARATDLMGRPRSDLLAVTMPCFGTTARTKGNAELLAERLGATLRQVDIKASVDLHFRDIGHDPAVRDVTYENAQARERTQVLMDLANDCGGLVVGTGDLSELALGWATYSGDHMSMYGVNASIPKTLVRQLVDYEARHAADPALGQVLLDILDTPVSPELLPASQGEIQQRTEDLVGPYALHDFFLYHLVRGGCPPRKLLRLALCAFGETYSRRTVLHWMEVFCRRFFSQQYKRSCLPDGPKVGPVSLSPRGDWRMPSDAQAALWLAEIQALQAAEN